MRITYSPRKCWAVMPVKHSNPWRIRRILGCRIYMYGNKNDIILVSFPCQVKHSWKHVICLHIVGTIPRQSKNTFSWFKMRIVDVVIKHCYFRAPHIYSFWYYVISGCRRCRLRRNRYRVRCLGMLFKQPLGSGDLSAKFVRPICYLSDFSLPRK